MISIEAHRASIGRFSGKAKCLSATNACRKSEGIDPALFLFLVVIFEVVLYGLTFGAIMIFSTYIIALLMLTLTYGYSFWILKQISDILSMITPKIAKTELMTVSSLPNVIRARPLIQCSYLDMPVLEGRLEYLEAIPVLDGRDEETQQQRNLKKSLLREPLKLPYF